MPVPDNYKIDAPFYPIVYVRGYAMTSSERENVFNDAYYGFSVSSVEKRDVPPPKYFETDIFEGQLIRFMKMEKGYADAFNDGERFHQDPSRSIWVCRFYDMDYVRKEIRSIESHAEELRELVCKTIPLRLKANNVDLGKQDRDYKVILIAHSMGGLVCRTLIQNILPKEGQDPKRWIHRLVTIGTPHRGIELGAIPDILENLMTSTLNPFDSNIFKETRMREYLKLGQKKAEGKKYKYDVHSLGPRDTDKSFPVKRCLCIIGSDHSSYGGVKHATGGFSDGLVKQDRAYVVEGEVPKDNKYANENMAFWVNVHRAHSGFRGIVNSYESFENIRRFLFGNIKVEIHLEEVNIPAPAEENVECFYDFEFLLSIRGTGVYLHRREQNPCENAIRRTRQEIKANPSFILHTAFMNSNLKVSGDPFSHFALTLRVVEHRVKPGFLWDSHYPGRQIYSETLEIRVGDSDPQKPGDEAQYRWFSERGDWKDIEANNDEGVYRFRLREAGSMSGSFAIKAGPWPDGSTKDEK